MKFSFTLCFLAIFETLSLCFLSRVNSISYSSPEDKISSDSSSKNSNPTFEDFETLSSSKPKPSEISSAQFMYFEAS
ncbi:MAG: Uncharacterised protein [Arcobacter lacus]|nr:MAG: Uncharacterised protein [Arcobacter lacus]